MRSIAMFRQASAAAARSLGLSEMDEMLAGGARWAVARGWREPEDLERVEDGSAIADAEPDAVSERARRRQSREMGTLGSGNHYLETQVVDEIFDEAAAAAFGLKQRDVVVVHCGSRGLGHQVATEFAKDMVVAAQASGLRCPTANSPARRSRRRSAGATLARCGRR